MRSVPVVWMQPRREMVGARVRGFIGAGVGPFARRRLDEALGFAVGARGVGLGADRRDPQALAQAAKTPGLVAGAVVGQAALATDA